MSLFMQMATRARDRASSSAGGGGGGGGGGQNGTISSFASSVWSPSAGSVGRREESYHLLLELCSQEPTMQCCFKIIESTCLARGIDIEIGGKPPTEQFRCFLSRYYLPFAESAIRYFFALGFVPWRLRKLSSGDVVPETIPLGMFTWAIESITNRTSRSHAATAGERRQPGTGSRGRYDGDVSARSKAAGASLGSGKYEMAAERSFQKQKAYFSDPKRVPYPLQGDVGRMQNRGDRTDQGKAARLQGFGSAAARPAGKGAADDAGKEKGEREDEEDAAATTTKVGEKRPRSASSNIPAYYRQRQALARMQGVHVEDDDQSKILRYTISFTENCEVLEDDVEIYEYITPTNSITRCSLLYGTVPTPLSHLLIDYRNIRTALIRQSYADAYNTQAKMICSYSAPKNMYNVSEGAPILNGEGWAPQQRTGMYTDTNIPTEIEANAYTRDAITETMVGAKPVEHKPIVYSLPKNTTLESQPKLESIVDIPKLQNKFAKDITALLGVPFEMVQGGYSDDSSGKSRAMHNTKIFITNMMSICRHIEMLLADVYLAAYGGTYEDVKFIIRPTPRIEVNTVEEICMLLEAGVVSFDNAMHLSNMILGIDLQQGAGVQANAGQFSRAFVTPSNKKDLMMAERAQKSKP